MILLSDSSMAEAVTLLAIMRKVGLHVRLDAGQLRVGPARLMEPYDVPYIKEHRDALTSILAAESTPAVRSATDATTAACVDSGADMAPQRTSCGICLHFPPDTITPATN